MNDKIAVKKIPDRKEIEVGTVYITKYALSKGIVKAEGGFHRGYGDDEPDMDTITLRGIGHIFGEGVSFRHRDVDWHTSLESAEMRVDVMIASRRKSIEKEIAKLDRLSAKKKVVTPSDAGWYVRSAEEDQES